MKEKELAKEIVKFCKENKIATSYNTPYRDILVSFGIKDKQKRCNECGKLK